VKILWLWKSEFQKQCPQKSWLWASLLLVHVLEMIATPIQAVVYQQILVVDKIVLAQAMSDDYCYD
jgi:hypothetical protein